MHLCSENKGTITVQLICAIVFAYVKSRISHDFPLVANDAAIYNKKVTFDVLHDVEFGKS